MEIKLTAGPKKAALENMRKKIEMSLREYVVPSRRKNKHERFVAFSLFLSHPSTWEAAVKALNDEEAMKQKLCEDLKNLVQESCNSQFARLDELKRRLESLNPSRFFKTVIEISMSSGEKWFSFTVGSDSDFLSLIHFCIHYNSGNVTAINAKNQLSTNDGEVKGKKKTRYHGRGKGIGAVPKGRGSAAPGWTGSGSDVDGRT
ncbi:uncharacterized protein LOC120184965 [Hibiscus syriacus]|uniref:uncharacterized protein LOC120184965 n=1 Tax=Hibiscus syriacus TaxID=106335 RepID=UPI00192305DE|nr:uncharacterized protein LOC120184965 [Hibiscus syriacus]